MAESAFPKAVLFDLDGTLLDSAPDMLATANAMLAARGRAPITLDVLRPVVSKGSRAMVSVAFPELGQEARDALVPEFLERYEALIGQHAVLFDGVDGMLEALEAAGCAWGIVTNKPARFTDPLMPLIGLDHAGCVVSGDTTPHPKPHPGPLLEAAKRLGLAPEQCWYVGDDLRDIQAGRAAGMPTVACQWGYCGATEPLTWEADHLVASPGALLDLIVASVPRSATLAA